MDKTKQALIERGANAWLKRLGTRDLPWRFDVIEVYVKDGEKPRINHVQGRILIKDPDLMKLARRHSASHRPCTPSWKTPGIQWHGWHGAMAASSSGMARLNQSADASGGRSRLLCAGFRA